MLGQILRYEDCTVPEYAKCQQIAGEIRRMLVDEIPDCPKQDDADVHIAPETTSTAQEEES